MWRNCLCNDNHKWSQITQNITSACIYLTISWCCVLPDPLDYFVIYGMWRKCVLFAFVCLIRQFISWVIIALHWQLLPCLAHNAHLYWLCMKSSLNMQPLSEDFTVTAVLMAHLHGAADDHLLWSVQACEFTGNDLVGVSTLQHEEFQQVHLVGRCSAC